MNPHTGELRLFDGPFDAGFEVLPDDLQYAARVKLAGAARATVSLTSGGKLAKWAKEKRKKQIAYESKRRNRK